MSLRYVLVDVDGTVTIGQSPAAHSYDILAAVDTLVGPEGHARVRLAPEWAAAGWVNDCGLLFPERYPRNLVGSCILAAMGAAQQPYAGPVVVTGWDEAAGHHDDIEICGLAESQVDVLLRLASDVRRVLGLEDGEVSFAGRPQHAAWAQEMTAYAELVRTGPTPGITILTDDEALDHLRGPR